MNVWETSFQFRDGLSREAFSFAMITATEKAILAFSRGRR